MTKAQRLLLKVQALLDSESGHELSRLEKDLLKSYILQLYDTVTQEEVSPPQEKQTSPEPIAKKDWKEHVVVEVPPVHVSEPPKVEPVKPVYVEVQPPKPQEKPVEMKAKEPEPVSVVERQKPVQITVTEQVKETVQKSVPVHSTVDVSEALVQLFELPKNDDVAERFSKVPITSIESAMGLNERIFTLSSLFGGDKDLFDATCSQLNNLSSFHDAKGLLLSGVAKRFDWADPERLKMAEEFIRIVARRYPKS